MNPWSTIVSGVPAEVTAILTDLTPALGLIVGLGVAAFIVYLIADVMTGR